MNGFPLAAVVVLGVGAYYLGRYDERKNTEPLDRPTPPLPPPVPPPDASSLPPSYKEEWDKALERYDIDVYPPESVPNVERLLPPPDASGISVSPDCHTVAVGEDWWELAAEYLNPERPAGSVAESILLNLAPTCARRRTLGSDGLRRELVTWIKAQTERNTPSDEDDGPRLTIG